MMNLSFFDSIFRFRKILLGLLFCFLVFGVKYHGFSFGAWSYVIPHYKNHDFSGSSKSIRSDDWLVSLPAAISQTQNSFSKNSLLLGSESVPVSILPIQIPSKHYSTLFRPHLWGYFISPDIGLSWQWCFYLFFGVLGWSVLNQILFPNLKKKTTLLLGVGLYSSPFFLAWSLNCVNSVLFFTYILIFLMKAFKSETLKKSMLFCFGLSYSVAAFGFSYYPPYQITLMWIGVFIFLGEMFSNPFESLKIKKLVIIVLFLGIGVLPFLFTLLESKEILNLFFQTDYPGKRIIEGGNLTILESFNGTLFFQFLKKWSHVSANICEESSFFLLGLTLPIIAMIQIKNQSTQKKVFVLFLFSITFILLSWQFIGLPTVISKIFLLSSIPENRLKLSVGILSYFWMGWWYNSESKKYSKILLCLNSVFVFLILFKFSELRNLPYFWVLILTSVISLFIGYLLSKKSELALVTLVFFQLIVMGKFNPIAFGGVNDLLKVELSQSIKKLDNGELWLAMGNNYDGNYLRMIGIKSITGVHFYPQFNFWKKLDPTLKFKKIYNRYAHVMFTPINDINKIEIKLRQEDVVEVLIHPNHSVLNELKINHFIIRTNEIKDLLEIFKNWKVEYNKDNVMIFSKSENINYENK